MTKRNPSFAGLSTHYLFPEINRRKKLFLEKHPEAQLINLGIGDTTIHLPQHVTEALAGAAKRLGTAEGYTGYGPEQGHNDLRKKIASVLYSKANITPDDVFISDGIKCDIGRLQQLFGADITIIVQDPAYPVYIDGSLIEGVANITHVPCTPENSFWPDWSKVPRADLIYWCSPNNPVGNVSTKSQLEELVAFAKRNHSIILFDAAYAGYIQDDSLPRSIYEIEGAEEVAIELGSFSKLAGFSGVRLGWSIVPEALKYEDGSSVKSDWNRLTSTIFNGASNIAQAGGLAVLEPEGFKSINSVIRHYLESTQLLRKTLLSNGYEVFGGDHAPYIWVKFPGMTSWEAFQYLLEKHHIVTTPGSGFGSQGEGYLRLSGFAHRAAIAQACSRLS